MPDDALHRLHLVDWRRCGCLLPAEEVADKDRLLTMIHDGRPILELFVVSLSRGELQLGYRFWVPSMLDTILAPRELALILQHGLLLCSLMQTDSVAGNLLQANTTDGADLCAEISSQQILAQADRLKDFRTTIGADGRDTHLRHDLLQALIHCLDIVLLGRCILLLNLAFLHQIVEDGKGHIRAECAGTIA